MEEYSLVCTDSCAERVIRRLRCRTTFLEAIVFRRICPWQVEFLQSRFRSLLASRHVSSLRREARCVRLQACARGMLARRRASRRRLVLRSASRMREASSARKLQTSVRTFLRRRRAPLLLENMRLRQTLGVQKAVIERQREILCRGGKRRR